LSAHLDLDLLETAKASHPHASSQSTDTHSSTQFTMAGLRGIFGFVSLVLIAASIVFMFFIILSGFNSTDPLNRTYFLRADTSAIEGARPVSQWTYFYVCGDGNQDCGAPVPALPFGYAWAGGGSGAPTELLGSKGKGTTSKYYFYMWRFGWVFYLIALIANVFGFLTSLLAPCSRLASGVAGFLVANALFWMTLASALMTAVFVKARDQFKANGMSATIGRWAFGWTWAAWACMFLATVFLFMGCGASNRGDATTSTTKTKGGLFRRKQSKRSARGSFIDTDSQRRVKDEYA